MAQVKQHRKWMIFNLYLHYFFILITLCRWEWKRPGREHILIDARLIISLCFFPKKKFVYGSDSANHECAIHLLLQNQTHTIILRQANRHNVHNAHNIHYSSPSLRSNLDNICVRL